jgi:hypothetical protein
MDVASQWSSEWQLRIGDANIFTVPNLEEGKKDIKSDTLLTAQRFTNSCLSPPWNDDGPAKKDGSNDNRTVETSASNYPSRPTPRAQRSSGFASIGSQSPLKERSNEVHRVRGLQSPATSRLGNAAISITDDAFLYDESFQPKNERRPKRMRASELSSPLVSATVGNVKKNGDKEGLAFPTERKPAGTIYQSPTSRGKDRRSDPASSSLLNIFDKKKPTNDEPSEIYPVDGTEPSIFETIDSSSTSKECRARSSIRKSPRKKNYQWDENWRSPLMGSLPAVQSDDGSDGRVNPLKQNDREDYQSNQVTKTTDVSEIERPNDTVPADHLNEPQDLSASVLASDQLASVEKKSVADTKQPRKSNRSKKPKAFFQEMNCNRNKRDVNCVVEHPMSRNLNNAQYQDAIITKKSLDGKDSCHVESVIKKSAAVFFDQDLQIDQLGESSAVTLSVNSERPSIDTNAAEVNPRKKCTSSKPSVKMTLTGGTRWAEWEHMEFLKGVKIHGRGKWSLISQNIPTRYVFLLFG